MSSSRVRRRERCFEAKGRECTVCSSKENIEIHHIDGDRANNALSNLAPFCKTCHGKVHSGAGGYEDWADMILPKDERTRQKALKFSPTDQRNFEIVRHVTEIENHSEAISHVLAEYVEIYDAVQDAAGDFPNELVSRRPDGTVRLSETIRSGLEQQKVLTDDVGEIKSRVANAVVREIFDEQLIINSVDNHPTNGVSDR